jgi:cyclic pyranopterin phosphate synthase
MTGLCDSFQRPINYLRVSVTDRCNLRCIYCMPVAGVRQMSHVDILSYEEIRTVVAAAAELGITKVRLTGGEPLVRLGLSTLVAMLRQVEAVDDISLTTNGTLLGRYAAELKRAGLSRVNVSLDTLELARFKAITRSDSELGDVLAGIEAARAVGLNPVKINQVVMAGINDDEVLDFAARTVSQGWHVRFIEFMPTAGVDVNGLNFVSVADIKRELSSLGELEPYLPRVGNGPARYFRFPGSQGSVGFISPVSEHFCFQCNRLRLTADGRLRPCLLSDEEIDLKSPLRSGASQEDLKGLIEAAAAKKPLRHRLAEGQVPSRRPMTQVGG